MPHHQARKTENQQNKSSMMEESITPKPKKQGERPASLNDIPKQES